MSKDSKYFDLIEDYIDGNLSPKEMKDFRERMAEDPELYKLYQIRQKLAESWNKADEYEAIRRNIADSIKSEKSLMSSLRKYYIPLAATIVILLSVYFGIKISQKNNINENFAIEELIDSTASDTLNQHNTIQLDFIETEHKASVDSITNNGITNGTDSIDDINPK